MSGNPLGMRGLAFVEMASDRPDDLASILRDLGLSRTHRHRARATELWTQNAIRFFVTREPGTFADRFRAQHGPCVSALGFAFDDPRAAFEEAVRRGAHPFREPGATFDVPAVYGIGDSLVYFVGPRGVDHELVALDRPATVPGRGFLAIDHLTNNVRKGTLARWSDYYEHIYGFTPVRSFDIEGNRSGLLSYALRSPCRTLCIPINEDKGDRGQIAEYLDDYRGPGVQHIAFLTRDLLGSLESLRGAVPTLDIDANYYEEAFQRVPNVREDKARLRAHRVLLDGDERGYLLQIFTKNLVGPMFFEFIQRENHLSFGEGNFSALFRSIERDQEKRGVL